MKNKILTAVLPALSQMGMRSLILSYDGSGDEGSVQDTELIDSTGNNILIEDAGGEVVAYFEAHQEEIEDYLVEILNSHFDWYNNEGGFGTITFDFQSFSVKIDNSSRYISYEEKTILCELI